MLRLLVMTKRIALLALALTAACGGASTTSSTSLQAAAPSAAAAPVVSKAPVPVVTKVPHPVPSFRTPEAAMRYLADAWNRGDLTALKHVTDPSARTELWNMHREAANLRLKRCERLAAGDYDCTFTHDYPVGYKGAGKTGMALFRVGPATRGGWYMTVYETCG